MSCVCFFRGKTILDSCPYMAITAHYWYPTQINGHTFTGRNADTFRLPETLLEVPAPTAGPLTPSACRQLQLTEFTSEHWFLTNDKTTALNGKVRRHTGWIIGVGLNPQAVGRRPQMRGRVKPIARVDSSVGVVQTNRGRCCQAVQTVLPNLDSTVCACVLDVCLCVSSCVCVCVALYRCSPPASRVEGRDP